MSTDVKKSTGTATKKIVLVGVFGAISTVLMFLSFNVPFIPTFVKLDFSDLPVLLGGYILRHPELLETLDDDAIKLWVWHAIEEIEHRAVAFDVYQAVYKDDKVRRTVMRSVTTGFASLTFYSASRLFIQDRRKSLPKVSGNAYGLYLIGKMLIELIPEYLSYYKADFHPSDIDYTDIVALWKQKLALEYDMEGFQEAEQTPELYH